MIVIDCLRERALRLKFPLLSNVDELQMLYALQAGTCFIVFEMRTVQLITLKNLAAIKHIPFSVPLALYLRDTTIGLLSREHSLQPVRIITFSLVSAIFIRLSVGALSRAI